MTRTEDFRATDRSRAALGIAWQADVNAPGWFSGTIDEVRVSRFARGSFGNPTLTYDDNGNLTSDPPRGGQALTSSSATTS